MRRELLWFWSNPAVSFLFLRAEACNVAGQRRVMYGLEGVQADAAQGLSLWLCMHHRQAYARSHSGLT